MKKPMTIMLHGWGMQGGVFNPLLDALADDGDYYCPQLPGYSGSSWAFESDFEVQLAQMGNDLPDAGLLGWSMGGLYAIELARRFPRKFKRVTLVACNPCFVARPGWRCAISEDVLDAFQVELERDWRRTLRRFAALQVQGETDARRLARDLWHKFGQGADHDLEVLRFGLELLRSHDARSSLARLEQPVALILGAHDQLVPVDLCQQISDVAPKIQVESLAGAAHAPFFSDPIALAARLKTFL